MRGLIMTATGIQDLCLEWPAKQRQILTAACHPSDGRTLADWDSFVLSIREDPGWPRSGGSIAVFLDPTQGEDPVVQVTGTPMDGVNVEFVFTVPTNPGKRRYALDVRGIGGVAGEVAFIHATWLSVIPSVR
jgi:hypothetical protein